MTFRKSQDTSFISLNGCFLLAKITKSIGLFSLFIYFADNHLNIFAACKP